MLIKFFLYVKNLCKAEYQFLINNRESTGLKYLNDFKAFIEYSNELNNIYKTIEEYNPNKKLNILTVFHYMIADMISIKNLI